MDSDRLNRWLTLGANLGVLIGLVVLIVEIQQNTEMMRAQIVQTRADNLIASMEDRMHSDYWPSISAKLRINGQMQGDRIETLNVEERERVLYYYLREMNDVRSQYLQWRSGFLPDRLWNTSSRAQVRRLLSFAAVFERPCVSALSFWLN